MAQKFDLSAFHYATEGDPDQWEVFVRRQEVKRAMAGFEPGHFRKGLELGCGSGKHSRNLARFCRSLVAIEYTQERLLEKSDEKVTFLVGDAENLSRFKDAEFDFVFSSNLLEHLANLQKCLQECARVTADDAVIIHMVPNRTWKLFHMVLYYPFLVKRLLRGLCRKRTMAGLLDSQLPNLDMNLRPVKRRTLLDRLSGPSPHGISQSNLREFCVWGKRHWMQTFRSNGFEIVKVVRQPFYFGYEDNFKLILKAGNALGLSACTGYILRKLDPCQTIPGKRS